MVKDRERQNENIYDEQTEWAFSKNDSLTESLYEKEQNERRSNRMLSLFAGIFSIIILVILLLNTYVYINVQIKGPSMLPTLKNDYRVVVNVTKTPNRGDIVIIADEKPNSSDWIVKRVIAVGGDKVELIDGYVWLNGAKLNEPYVKEQGITTSKNKQEWTLNENEIFYLGDNRGNSMDSRSEYDLCQTSQIIGVVENWSISFANFLNGLWG